MRVVARSLALLASQPQVGEAEGIDSVVAEYADNELFRECAVALGHKLGYTGLRRMRPDGSCFYRGWLWALLRHMSKGGVTTPASEVHPILGPSDHAGTSSSSAEAVAAGGASGRGAAPPPQPAAAASAAAAASSVTDSPPVAAAPAAAAGAGAGAGAAARSVVALPSTLPLVTSAQAVYDRLVGLHAGAVPRLAAAGLEPLVVEDFAAAFGEMLMALPGSDPDVATALLSADMDSMYLIVMLRYLASAGVAESEAVLAATLAADSGESSGGGGGDGGGGGRVAAYRRGRVEGTSAEADHVAIACLSAVTGIPVAVVSLSATGSPGVAVFPAGASAATAPVHLLLRPGHYDVLTRE